MASNYYEITYGIKHFDTVYEKYVKLWKKNEADVKSRGGSMGDPLYSKDEFADFYIAQRREMDTDAPDAIIKKLVKDQQYHVSEKQARELKKAAKRLGVKNLVEVPLPGGGKRLITATITEKALLEGRHELDLVSNALTEVREVEIEKRAAEFMAQGIERKKAYEMAKRAASDYIAFTYFGSP